MPNYLNPKVSLREREDAAGLTDSETMPAAGMPAPTGPTMPTQQFTKPGVDSPEVAAAKKRKLIELLRMRGG